MHIINEHLETQVIDPLLERTRRWHPTVRYLSQTEVHVYALSIAASVLLSLYPFLTVMYSLARFFDSSVEQALNVALLDYFPGELGVFIQRNLLANLNKPAHSRFQIVSIVLLMLTANGVFEPLEVALNRVWGAATNRSYLRNQIMSFGLIILCGGLVIGSAMLTAVNEEFVKSKIGGDIPELDAAAAFQARRDTDDHAGAVPHILAAAELPGAVAATGPRVYSCRRCAGDSEICGTEGDGHG